MVTRRLMGVAVNASMLGAVPVAKLNADREPMAHQLKLLAQESGARTLDPMPDICGIGPTCSPFFDNGEPKFVDDKHLRPVFVKNNITFFDFLLTH